MPAPGLASGSLATDGVVADLTRADPTHAGGEGLDANGLDAAYALPGGRSVRANFAVSVDGAIEVDGRSGSLGGPADRVVFAHLRGMADVVLVGAGTVRAEDYGPVRLDGPARERRAGRGQAPSVPIAVVTNRAQLEPSRRLFSGSAAAGEARPLILTSAAAPIAARGALKDVADVVVCGETEVDPVAALEELAERGLLAVLCEGGPTVLSLLVRAALLDEICLTFAPVLAGAGHAGLAGPAAAPSPGPASPGAASPGPAGASSTGPARGGWAGRGDPSTTMGLAAVGSSRLDLIGLLADGEGTLFARYRVQPPPGRDPVAPLGS